MIKLGVLNHFVKGGGTNSAATQMAATAKWVVKIQHGRRVSQSERKTTCGLCIRDEAGMFVRAGTTWNHGIHSIIEAEALALLEAMQAAIKVGTRPTCRNQKCAPHDNNIMLWNAVIFGPDDTPWNGGSKQNVGKLAKDGVDEMGARLAQEICYIGVINFKPSLVKCASLVWHQYWSCGSYKL
ncbi:unnamed protein product [Trifolium pratense]|uniref:Uncharacterized protein n=1 Tax=Trifolium pratense TaxID=57577 RepID=A0ACB0LDF4_TRIPR|nr:unnamed protein product [Trifolium pratense]